MKIAKRKTVDDQFRERVELELYYAACGLLKEPIAGQHPATHTRWAITKEQAQKELLSAEDALNGREEQ